jgi:vacuolar-type H+-ATPase subunit H
MAEQTGKLSPGSLPPPGIELSPLDQIRQAEADITRQVAAARQSAVHSLDVARKEAAHLVAQARKDGQQEGQTRCQEIIEAAKGEAKRLVEQAQAQVNEHSQTGTQRMELAVQQIIDLVIGSNRG